jgi:hypothetical protein
MPHSERVGAAQTGPRRGSETPKGVARVIETLADKVLR